MLVDVTPGEAGEGEITLSMTITDYAGTRYGDVLLEVRSAIPGLPLDEWDVVPGCPAQPGPCWYTLIDTAWVERLTIELEERGLEGFADDPPDLTDGPDEFTHIVPNKGLTAAMVSYTPVKGLCGRSFVPMRDSSAFDLCPDCVALQATLEALVAAPEV
jgi:hypothetical protein